MPAPPNAGDSRPPRLGLLLMLFIITSSAAARGEEGKTLSVTGTGVVKLHPDVVEVEAVVLGQAELAADALKQLRDNRRRAEETINGLKISGLKFHSSKRSVHTPNSAQQASMVLAGQEGENPIANHVIFHEKVTLRLEGIDKLEPEQVTESLVKIIDAAKDAALIIGSNSDGSYSDVDWVTYGSRGDDSPVRFRASQTEAARRQALELAVQDARAKAERLATLLGVKVGPVRSASHSDYDYGRIDEWNEYPHVVASAVLLGDPGPRKENDVEIDRVIPISASLSVVYDIAD